MKFTLNTMSQLFKLTTNISTMKFTPCIFHLKFLHIAIQLIVSLLAVSTMRGLMLMRLQCNLLAIVVLIKLWILPKSTNMDSKCLSILPVTFKVGNPITPSKAFKEMRRLIVSKICVSFILPSPSLSSLLMMQSE
jgi:hypothetical protein